MQIKEFKTDKELVTLLQSRGMAVQDTREAITLLQHISYYRLSGYWYPFRKKASGIVSNQFYEGTTLADVVRLYRFDSRLRTATFEALTQIELYLRTRLGHALGEIDKYIHLHPLLLELHEYQQTQYQKWLDKYKFELSRSSEDFVKHHRNKYGGTLPIWVAVEILDWGNLTYLLGFSPVKVQQAVANTFGLSAPQLLSWMRCLNIVRNIRAHHSRLFNRVYTLTPKLPRKGIDPTISKIAGYKNRTFGQLCLIQHMLDKAGIGRSDLLIETIKSYPSEVRTVPVSHMGVPDDWQKSTLWERTQLGKYGNFAHLSSH